MNWIDPNVASYYIPKIIIDAQTYTLTQQLNILTKYSYEPKFAKSLLFFIQLFQLPNINLSYDLFNFIPLSRDEIVGLTVYTNTFDTLMTNKITLKSFHIKYTP